MYNRSLPPPLFFQTYWQLEQLNISMFDTLWPPFVKLKEFTTLRRCRVKPSPHLRKISACKWRIMFCVHTYLAWPVKLATSRSEDATGMCVGYELYLLLEETHADMSRRNRLSAVSIQAGRQRTPSAYKIVCVKTGAVSRHSQTLYADKLCRCWQGFDQQIWYDIFVNCNWVHTRW
jgi:hypothetical protein